MDLLPPRPLTSLESYVRASGMEALERARAAAPDDVIAVVSDAGVRGRGGAGFPTARKWAGVRAATGSDDECFVVVNAAEGEPGTFKDRALIRANPFLVLEGALIAAHCVGAPRIVVATKAAYHEQVAALRAAIEELARAGWLEGVGLELVEGPDHYLFGEETALLEVIEGDDPLPRQIPPYLYGLYTTGPQLGWSAGIDDSPGGPATPSSNPVVVNNAETFAHAALVVRNGAAWYRAAGTTESPGPTIVTITGDVRRPAVAEVPLGIPLGELIDELAGGARPGHSIKAVLSGVANPVLTAATLDAPVTYEGLAAAGGGLGSAGFIVYDDTRNMVDVAYQVARFLHIESCGQCNSCKLGTHDITVVLEHLVLGAPWRGDPMASLRRHLAGVTDAARCFLPTQAQVLVASLLDRFPEDLAERLAGGRGDAEAPLPRIVDLRDGVLELAGGPPFKQPDWTLADVPVRLTRR
jgi:NADH-quinone oxidoreductase subunit F